jgi:HK97 family phage major capsid protein
MGIVRTELLELAEVETPDETQAARFTELETEFDTLEVERAPLAARAEKLEVIRSAALDPANREGGFGGRQVIIKKDPFENVEALRFSYDDRYAPAFNDDIVSRAVTALSDPEYRPRGIKDSEIESAVRMVETVPGVAQHALIHGSTAYRSAFSTFLKAQGGTPLYSPAEAEAVRTSLSLSGANGGYTLPTLLDPTLIHTGTAVKDPIRDIARIVSGTQNVWHGVSVGNVTTYWKAEGSAMTEGSPTLANPSITAAMLTAYLTASYEIFEDSGLQSQLPGLIGEAFSYAEQTAFISGSGSTAPKGIITAISATAGSTVTATTRGEFTTGSAVDVFALLGSLPSRYEASSTWVANKATFNTIRQMSPTGGTGSLFWTNFNDNTLALPSLLGSPIRQASDMATATTSGTVLAILGDFSQFVVYDRVGTSVEFMQNVVDGSGLPTGQRGLVAHKRVGSDCTDINAFRFLKT